MVRRVFIFGEKQAPKLRMLRAGGTLLNLYVVSTPVPSRDHDENHERNDQPESLRGFNPRSKHDATATIDLIRAPHMHGQMGTKRVYDCKTTPEGTKCTPVSKKPASQDSVTFRE